MKKLFIFLVLGLSVRAVSQLPVNAVFSGCATDHLMSGNTAFHQLQDSYDLACYNFLNGRFGKPSGIQSVVYVPVVVHIIHNGGAENISNSQVQAAINNVNSNFQQSNGYHIQFCLAQRDPNNNPTNGITRDVSPLTSETMETDDIALKNINRWPPNCYLNIWLVRDINSISQGNGVIGYAYLPSAAGTNVDGVVIEAAYFGSSIANDGVATHELGHYFGLYHTFQNGCVNNNCLLDGDQVCDTPPDQTTFSPCYPSANSCNTDANDPSSNNPFTTDVPDLSDDYMDYSSLSCYTQFTFGQYARMQFFLTNVRNSLLNCLSCTGPCPNPVSAQISSPSTALTTTVGISVNFSGTSTNATGYQWYINPGSIVSTGLSGSYTFNSPGTYWLKFRGLSANPQLCLDGIDSVQIIVIQTAVAACAGSLFLNSSVDAVDLPPSNQYYDGNGFTWECWFKLNGPFNGVSRPLINSTDSATFEDIFLGFGWNFGVGNFPNTELGFKVDGPNSSTGPSSISCHYALPGGFSLGTWYHAAGVMDYATHTAKLYLNGVLVDTKTVNSGSFTRIIKSRLGIGTLSLNPLYGNLDEVRIWKRVKTDTEILTNYNQCLSGNETDLVLYYHCNQSAGSFVTDATSNNNTGIILNGAWSIQQPVLASSCAVLCDACSKQVAASQDTIICPGSSAGIYATPGFDHYVWIPATGLSNDTIEDPIATPSVSTSYVVKATKLDSNLLTNGDFKLGNTGFTSNYTFSNTNFSPCYYSVNSGIFSTSIPQSDHTPTSDNMFMMVNGCNSSTKVWEEIVGALLPNTDYRFSFWIGGDTSSANIEVKINGVIINTFTYTPVSGANFPWYQYVYTWSSGASTSATLTLTDLSTSINGNDFGLDDMAFQRVCTSYDTLRITVRNKGITALDLGPDTNLCENGVIIIHGGKGFLDYTWNDGSKDSVYTVYGPGKYWVTVKDSCNGLHSDTLKIMLAPSPTLNLGGDSAICSGDSILLAVSPPGVFSTYHWNPATGLSCAYCLESYAHPGSSTTYYIAASTSQGCTASDSIIINVNEILPSLIGMEVLNDSCGKSSEIHIDILGGNSSLYQFNFNHNGYSSIKDYTHLNNGSYDIEIKNAAGCLFDTTAIIATTQKEEIVNVPNCFSPNGDGINDNWYISGTCIESVNVLIYNRWGEKVRSIDSINDNWDGKYKGSLAPDGTYFYILQAIGHSGAIHKTQGFISLFR